MKLKSLIKNFLPANNLDYYPDGVIIIDSLQNITLWNKKAGEIFGYTRQEMAGRNIAILFDAETEKINEAAKHGKIMVLSSKNSLDEPIFVEVACKVLPGRENIMLALRDVTKNQKVIEKLLIEYETASKINNNKSKFIVGLSGDLKTPLHSLIGFSQGLLDGVCGKLTEKQAKYVAIINKNANNLLDIIDTLLELSAVEAGSVETGPKVFDVVKTLNLICGKIRQNAEKKGLQFETDFNDIVRKNIYSDEAMLSRVLASVLENAVKFTEIGSVRIKVLHPDIEILKNQGMEMPQNFNDRSYLMFQVTDTGIGLSEEDMSFVFDEYSRTDRSLVKKYGGTGIKLALAKKTLALHGGAIWVESEPGQGSTFSFIIPAERPRD